MFAGSPILQMPGKAKRNFIIEMFGKNFAPDTEAFKELEVLRLRMNPFRCKVVSAPARWHRAPSKPRGQSKMPVRLNSNNIISELATRTLNLTVPRLSTVGV